jgi:dTDP-4-dehydrorhamnose 3,5-epimerase
MKFGATALSGVILVEPEPHVDARGAFARLWCAEEFAAHGVDLPAAQASLSVNPRVATLRGLHFQRAPARETRLVRCQRGRVFDVLLDLRPGSPTFMRHVATELDARRHNAVVVPPGVAHGFLTLEPDCEVHYTMSAAYRAELADGVRFDDPAFGIAWPLAVARIHERDRDYPDFDRDAFITSGRCA